MIHNLGDRNSFMPNVVILISAGAEWRVVRETYPDAVIQCSPFGEWFDYFINDRPVVFLQGGWGKISAAASAQYALDRWSPELLVNLGTCGGFAGQIDRGQILLVERTLVYDIIEQMGDPDAAIAHYSVDLDLSWLKEPYPLPVCRSLLVSADRDICPADIPHLIDRYGATAADWESGAIAWVASRYAAVGPALQCLILRGVSDLVDAQGGEAYNAIEVFRSGTRAVMQPLLHSLPAWLDCI
jgi:adenosylhomocysteine nucleosidase